MRKLVENTGISEDLRGYAWDRPPVEPINDVRISVSDINGFCPTRRDVFVKYVLKERPEVNHHMLRGLAFHRVIRDTLVSIKKAIYQGVTSGEEIIETFFSRDLPQKICKELGIEQGECSKLVKLHRYLVIQAAARVDEIVSKHPNVDGEEIVGLALPPFIERKIDGSLVGLSKHLSVDVFAPQVVVDFKSGSERDSHLTSLTGYAIALEADDETDVNFGFLIYIAVDERINLRQRGFVVSDELRREFIEVRDEIAEIIESGTDPGKPPECPRFCSYYSVCNEGCC